jgi:hypothetical protein
MMGDHPEAEAGARRDKAIAMALELSERLTFCRARLGEETPEDELDMLTWLVANLRRVCGQRRWTDAEDQQLFDAVQLGITVPEIALRLNRPIQGVRSRLKRRRSDRRREAL